MQNRLKTSPIPVQRTTRASSHRVLTSLPAGKMVPLAAMPLLREDSVTRAQFMTSFEMAETVEILMNAVNVRVMAYLVPNLALERFGGSLDILNKSYEGIPPMEGADLIPWFETMVAPAHGASAIHTYMGKHFKPGTNINTAYIEAYNAVWNFRARNRSPDITLRDRLAETLAPAFWDHQTFAHIVPDFDQAVIDGEVALNVASSNLTLSQAYAPVVQSVAGIPTFIAPGGSTPSALQSTAGSANVTWNYGAAGTSSAATWGDPALRTALTGITAELADNGITVSLSNIDMARTTQAFARLRQEYSGHSDEWIIDLLMDGISIPDQVWKHPILLYDNSTQFGMSKRYASDAGNLTESVVNGMTMLPVSFSVPRVPTGGVVMLFAEITPEQLFERQKDPYLHAQSVADLPQFLRDTLDPEKVSVVQCDEIDIDHDTPTTTFGYAPLNHEWMRSMPQIGGRFYRPAVDAAFDEDRQRIWAVETQNPVLSADFYLCTTMHTKPFVVTNQDPFEVLVRGEAAIQGNTVFGGLLVEATNNYAEIVEEQPTDRIVKA